MSTTITTAFTINSKKRRAEHDPADVHYTEETEQNQWTVNADIERYSRIALLMSIAHELVPTVVRDDIEVILEGEELRCVDRAFLAWPVRYPTPSSVYCTPADEDDDLLASIGFWWDIDSADDVKMVTFDIHYDGEDTFELVAQDKNDQALLERVDADEE